MAETRSYDELLDLGWAINDGKGVALADFTSLSFCLVREGHTVACVQGYGPTREAALLDATAEANAWMKRHRILEERRLLQLSSQRRGRYRRYA